jgi:hypothetical protein
MKRVNEESLATVRGAVNKSTCFGYGVAFAVGTGLGPMGWLGSAVALWQAYESGCFQS